MKKKNEQEQHKLFEGLKEKLKAWGVDALDPKKPEKQDEKSTDTITKQTGLLILEALEQVSKTVQSSSTKTDINNIVDRVNNIAQLQSTVQNSFIDLKQDIQKEVNIMMEGLKTETNQLAKEIKQLDSVLQGLYQHVSSISTQTSKFSEDLSQSTHSVKESISKGTSGFWAYFILFQI